MKFVRQTFPSRMVAGMTGAIMSGQKKRVEIAKLKVENKHEVKLAAMLLGGRMRVPCWEILKLVLCKCIL